MRIKGHENLENKKVAIVCDWLTNYAGAERVISAVSELFPKAPIFTTVYNKGKMREFGNREVCESFIGKLPFARRLHQLYISLMPYAFEAMDLSEYDLVISSSHACAKGIITGTSTVHVCYCHSPIRYLWDGCHEYVKNYGWYRWPFAGYIDRQLSKLRVWDRIASARPDHYLANSHFVAERIRKYYGRESTVIHPPVTAKRSGAVEPFPDQVATTSQSSSEAIFPPVTSTSPKKRAYYLAVGRLIPYKRFDLLVDAFNKLSLPLYIVGEGKEFARLKEMAGPNITFLGFVSETELGELYAGAKAFLFPQCEDFGIAPLEAMAHGTPVIAYKKGGAVETVKDGVNGMFFEDQTVESVVGTVREFEKKHHFDPEKVRASVEKFSKERFQRELSEFLTDVMK